MAAGRARHDLHAQAPDGPGALADPGRPDPPARQLLVGRLARPRAPGRLPRLTEFGLRNFIAGRVPNRPGELVRWIRDSQSIDPGTAMPNLNVPEPVARDMAAYLYTLR
ncbi:MAG: hypothetical protein HY703_04545 [Gemmatimonadetes bacterium]|nr:hypothetical protein [Gemmatimonadota bacterium]